MKTVYVRIGMVAALVAVVGVVVLIGENSLSSRVVTVNAWGAMAKEQHCVMVGYAGSTATPFYKCDDGFRVKYHIAADK